MPALKDLEGEAWILRESGSGTRDFFLRHVAEKLNTWCEAFTLAHTQAIINCISCGLGIGCLSKTSALTAIKQRQITTIDAPLRKKRTYSIVYCKDKYQSLLFKTFITFCHDWQMQSRGSTEVLPKTHRF